MPVFRNPGDKGRHVERLAHDYLVKRGLKPVAQNIRSRYGEIDLVMRDGQEWVFVEVRFRRNAAFGGGLESVDRGKCRKLVKTAEHYMQRSDKIHFDTCRFDIIEVAGELSGPRINWVRDAFPADV